MKLRIGWIILLLCIIGYGANAQGPDFTFHLPGQKFVGICQSTDGTIWTYTQSNRIYQLDGKSIELMDSPIKTAIHQISSHKNRGIIFSTHSGLYAYSDKSWRHIMEKALPGQVYSSYFGDSFSFYSDPQGIWKSDGGSSEVKNWIQPPLPSDIKDITPLRDQFFGYSGEFLWQWDLSGQSKEYRIEEGIRDISPDCQGQLVLITGEGSLKVLDHQTIKNYLIPQLPSGLKVTSIVKSDPYLVIVSAGSGGFIWDHRDYSMSRIPEIENTFGALVDVWGSLWLASDDGLSKWVVPKLQNAFEPVVTVTGIQKNGRPVPRSENPIVEIRRGEILSIDFKVVDPSRTNPQKVEYRLDDAEEWSLCPESESPLVLSGLPTGQYKMQLRATSDGKYYGYTDVFLIEVLRPVISTIWLFIFEFLAILIAVWYFSFRRMKNKSNKLTEDRNRLLLENKLLQSERKTKQLQMNPHFIFNSLQSIQGLIAGKRADQAMGYLQSFSKLLRSALTQSREERISLGDEIRFLKEYMQLENMNRSNNFEYAILKQGIDLETEIPAMLIQPLLENAVKHGLKGKGSNIIIEFKQGGRFIDVTITDDGIGRKNANRQKNYLSYGTQIIGERIHLFNNRASEEILKYEDLVDADGEPAGTKVSLQIPIIV